VRAALTEGVGRSMKTPRTVLILSLSLIGCAFMFSGARKSQMEKATVSPRPTPATVMTMPAVTTPDGGMYRIVTFNDSEACINGEIPGTAATLKRYTFTLSSYKSPEEKPDAVPTAVSSEPQVLGSYSAGKSMVQLQVCFDKSAVINDSTNYLVLEADPGGLLGSSSYAVWHFNDTIRQPG
jgi:hypothetical protein